MERILNEFDTFKLTLQENVDNYDYQVIFMLYQPIIGVNAANLYLTLLQEKKLTARTNLDFNHSRLMLLLNLDKVDLLANFKILEMYNLVISYYYPLKSIYIYDLKRPLNPEQFFANAELTSALKTKLGSLHYERQKYYFLQSEPEITEDFINISCQENNNYSQENHSYQSLKSLLTNLNKPEASFTTLQKQVFAHSQTNNPYQASKQSYLQQENVVNINHNNTIMATTILAMEEKTPEEYFAHLTKTTIDDKFKTLLKSLAFNYHLNNGVINCLLEYVWFKNNKRLEPNYILKIAQTFREKAINNVPDALNHLKLAYAKSKTTSYQNSYQQDVIWTREENFVAAKNEEIKNETLTNNGTMSKEEIKKILEDFENF